MANDPVPGTDAAYLKTIGDALVAGTSGGLKTEPSLGQPSLATDFGTVTKANAKASAGTVRSVAASNANASVRYLQLHNKATAPAATDVPLYSIVLPAGSASQPTLIVLGDDFFTAAGKAFGTGIGWAISTTRATFTDAATASDHAIHLHYS